MSWPCWKHLSVFPAGEKCPASELYANRRLLEERESGAAGTDRSQPPKTLPKADEENVREALWVHESSPRGETRPCLTVEIEERKSAL